MAKGSEVKTLTFKGAYAMRTCRTLYTHSSEMYTCELESCPVCGEPLTLSRYSSGRKIVQTLSSVLEVGYWPKQCDNPACGKYGKKWRSMEWEQIAPLHCTYGFDVIATIGWNRQTEYHSFERIHSNLHGRMLISESQTRYLYTYRYLPLLACHERTHWDKLEQASQTTGLIIGLDGLAPEGGEPQLWVVRELLTGLTLRSGWMSEQKQSTFENFLSPIAQAGLRVTAVLSDKQQGLLPAIGVVFPEARHALCQSHYLKNIAEPISSADEAMKVNLRKTVRKNSGAIIRAEHVEQPGVLTVTGLLPSPIDEPPTQSEETQPEPIQEERDAIVSALMQRVRYLLTLKGRPPFRTAGIEMFEGLEDVCEFLESLIAHLPDDRLIELRQGLREALDSVRGEYKDLREAVNWLKSISAILDPEGKPFRTGHEVKDELFACLDQLIDESMENPTLSIFAVGICKTTINYAPGLFHTYDVPGLPRTNNDRESEFRRLNQRLLRITGQKGTTKRLIHRSGAWELIPHPGSFMETVAVLSQPQTDEFNRERQRVREHRNRFKLHTRSTKQTGKQLEKLKARWMELPRDG